MASDLSARLREWETILVGYGLNTEELRAAADLIDQMVERGARGMFAFEAECDPSEFDEIGDGSKEAWREQAEARLRAALGIDRAAADEGEG